MVFLAAHLPDAAFYRGTEISVETRNPIPRTEAN
jgi:hypothetical protein